MQRTIRAGCAFKLKEYPDGRPFVAVESADDASHLPLGGRGFLHLDLKEGATYEEAEELVRKLNDQVAALAHTSLP